MAEQSSFETKGQSDFRDVEAAPPSRRVHHNEDLGRELPQGPNPHGFYGKIGNPGVLGLAAHAVTLMLLATQFMKWRGVTVPQVYIGNLWFYAGLYMFTTAQWCLIKGETFAYCVFGTFSAFYFSYAAILTPTFAVADAFAGAAGTTSSAAAELQSLAIFLFVWNGVFFIIFLASLRTNAALVVVFFGVIMGVWCLGGMYLELATIAQAASKGSMSKAVALSKAGGAFLFVSASSGFYLVIVQLFESVDFPISLPVGDLSGLWPKKKSD
ncbi:hypothetical protein T439DRAFT_378786 [Meredithblackwellia eburnea MCA 4105]